MEKGADKTEIIATKIAEGKVATHINGNPQDVLEMLAMLQRSVALLIMENGKYSRAVAEIMLLNSLKTGVDMAVKDRGGK